MERKDWVFEFEKGIKKLKIVMISFLLDGKKHL